MSNDHRSESSDSTHHSDEQNSATDSAFEPSESLSELRDQQTPLSQLAEEPSMEDALQNATRSIAIGSDVGTAETLGNQSAQAFLLETITPTTTLEPIQVSGGVEPRMPTAQE